jgi:Mycobacterium membrane protein
VKTRRKRRNTAGILSKLWLPAIILVVLVVVGYGVNSVRHVSDAISYPPSTSSIPATVVQINPKNVTYEVFGDLGSGGRVVYANLDSQPIAVTLTSLPWSHSMTTMSPSVTLSLVTQVDGGSLGCRIIVNGEVRDEQSVAHDGAAVACTVTAA